MELADILTPERVVVDVTASSKKSLLEKAAQLLANAADSADARDIFESLCQRERLGSTGLGNGVAIPHGRVQDQASVAGALIRLQRGIDFDSPDSEKVDLFFALAVPSECTDAHLKLLASIAQRFGDSNQREAFRTAETASQLHKLIAGDSAEVSP